MPSLLVPTDDSTSAIRAVDHAIAHAIATDSEVHVLHVQPHAPVYGMIGAYRAGMDKVSDERSRTILAAAARRLKRAGVRHTVHTANGEVAPTIVTTAQRLGCDGIIMGTRGVGGLAKRVLGSVAASVVDLTELPVTLVK